jgi:MFS transporter, DHA1 family, inner membrane transport protein
MAAGRSGTGATEHPSRDVPRPVVIAAGPGRSGCRDRPPPSRSERRAVLGLVVGRVGVHGGIRVVYPFLPVVADALQISFVTLALVVASRNLIGVAGPLIAPVVTPRRTRVLLLSGLGLTGAGALMVVAAPGVPDGARVTVLLAGFAATGLARPLFDLPLQAWVAAHVPVSRRGRAVGMTEVGWALSLVATVPLAGWLVPRWGWSSPFQVVVVLAAVGAMAVWLGVPREASGAPVPPPGLRETAHSAAACRRTSWIPAVVTVCAAAALVVAAGELLLVVYGPWLAGDFGLSVSSIALTALLIAAAELTGELAAAAVADRIGLCRTVFIALALSVVVYAGLSGIAHMAVAAVAIVVWFVAFEVTVVVLIALAGTIVTEGRSRARLLGALMAAFAVGNALGAALAPVLFDAGGIVVAGTASAGLAFAGGAVLLAGSRRGTLPARRAAAVVG